MTRSAIIVAMVLPAAAFVLTAEPIRAESYCATGCNYVSAPKGGDGTLRALEKAWLSSAVRYARKGMLDPRAYNAAYSRYESYRDRYYSDEGRGGKRLQSWVRRQSIYNR